MIWISKWVDYSDKYGLGYQFSNDILTVSFNDKTRIAVQHNQNELLYVNKVNHESYFQAENPPKELAKKKLQVLNYFRNYMNQYLFKMGKQHAQQAEDLSRVPFMENWFRTRTAIVMFLSNGTFQVNFFQDHTKLIICPSLSAVTFVYKRRNFRTYLFDTLIKHGATSLLKEKLTYANSMVTKMMDETDLRPVRQDAAAKRHPHTTNSLQLKAVARSKPIPFR
ncbi:unnamed protein product [Cyprideis torosa]|uniref:POLO box domain-containing protein n=1 Tax=Cyprideis torosa TaxID=163714 RepID=A0A7R8ZSP2_9CRUS|nr:unnamed protein product [Cyprideis torosa]CAG0906247.1 unnamed protein product [Cyprideis torosa]